MANKDFTDYQFEIRWHDPDNHDPANAAEEIRLTANGQEYMATFATINFIAQMFEKNRGTGECSDGAYFCMPKMIIVKRIDEYTVRRTIDGLISDQQLEIYLDKV